MAADVGAVVVDDVGVDGVVVAEGDDGRDELGRSSGADGVSGLGEFRLRPDQPPGVPGPDDNSDVLTAFG